MESARQPLSRAQPDFILPAKLESSESVPLGRRQLLPVGDRHRLEELVQRDVDDGLSSPALAQLPHRHHQRRRLLQPE